MKPITKAALKKRLAAFSTEPSEQKAAACVLLGHSKIVTQCFGYVSCARCGEQIGDTLTQGPMMDTVLVGHNCKTCVANYARLTWHHKFLCPDPFAAEGEAA